MKKLLSLVLAVMMVSAMAVSAFADTITIVINDTKKERKYEAYQVFSGTVNAEGVMANIQWGEDVNGNAILAEITATNEKRFDKLVDGVYTNQFKDVTSAEKVADVLSKWNFNDPPVRAFADVAAKHIKATAIATESVWNETNKNHVITVDNAGYYIVIEVSDNEDITGTLAYTDYLLSVTNGISINPKTSYPTFTQLVNYQSEGTYAKAVDMEIGRDIYVKMEGSLPSMFNDYHQYHVHMYAKLPKDCLNYNGVYKIYIQHATAGSDITELSPLDTTDPDNPTGHYTVNTYADPIEPTKFVIVEFDLGNVKAGNYPTFNLNDKIVVKYKATLGGLAVMGTNNNKNTDFGNIITGGMEFSNDMNQPANTSDADIKHGELSDTSSVYTYQAEFKKADSLTDKALAGAEFNLYRNITGDGGAVSQQYALINNGVITGWQTSEPTTPQLHSNGVDANGDGDYDDSNDVPVGTFYIKGLDSLTYHLKEVTAPSGYNDMDAPVAVTIGHEFEGQKLKYVSCTADGISYNTSTDSDTARGAANLDIGKVIGTINNTPGSTLPATGGIGTTIFYIIGAMLLIGSSVIFIMKKRNEA